MPAPPAAPIADLVEPEAPAPDVEVDAREVGEPTDPGRKPRVEPAPSSELPSGETVEVLVLDPAGVPVAGAQVEFVDLSVLYEEAPELVLQGLDIDAARRRHGRVIVADEHGVARGPVSEAGGFVFVEKDGLFGLGDFDHFHEGGSTTVHLARDLALRVRVVDGSGAPVSDVPVALRYRDEDEVGDALVVATGSDGVAELRHLQDEFEGGRIEGEGVSVALALLSIEPIEVPLAPGPLPAGILELVLPPTGRLEVRLEDSRGGLVREKSLVELEIVPDAPPDADAEWERRYLRRSHDDRVLRRVGSAGRVLVERIGLGLELDVRVRPLERLSPAATRGLGPTRAGELAVLRVTGLTSLSRLTGRLVRSDGSPFAGAEVSTSLSVTPEEGGERGRSPALETDAEGRFALELDGDWPTSGRFDFMLGTTTSDGQRWWWTNEWQAELVPGENDLGDLVLEALPLVAAGRVTDEAGRPIAAVVELSLPGAEEGWKVSDRTTADGAFSLQARVDAPEVEVSFDAAGYAARSVTLPTGATDVVVALALGGGIEGQLLVADERAYESLSVAVRSADTEERSEASTFEGGRFALSDLPPGLYELLVEVHAEPESTVRIPDVRVLPGEVMRDPRLQPLDLGGLRTLSIALEGNDEDWVDLYVRRKAAGAAEFVDAGEWLHEYRELVLTTGHPALDLRITPRDGRTEELDGVSEDRVLRIRAGVPVVVRLVPPVALSDQEWLELSLESRTGTPLSDFMEPRFWDGEHAEILLPEPGPYLVRVNFLQQIPRDLATLALPIEPEIVLEVRETDELQTFDVTLPPAAREAIEAARR